VPSKIVKILASMGRVIGIPAPGFRSPCAWGTAALSFIGLFNGAPDLAERREEILREEFAKRTNANR
jgi:hypothetical protein